MTDPLSLTLATITLATALKDMVELAQMIEESFEKVSRNTRELRSMASEIKTTVLHLKEFSEDNYNILCNAVDMKVALFGLMANMRDISDRCHDMLPPAPSGKMGKYKVAVTGWVNRNKIEDDIKDLRNRVNKCHMQFVLFAVMRIESHLVITKPHDRQEPRQGQEIETIGAFNNDPIASTDSDPPTLSRLPREVTPDFISDTYLCLQIDTINVMLTRLSSSSYPVEVPSNKFLLPYRPVAPQVSFYDKNSVRQKIILQLLNIQSYLRSDSKNLLIQAGAWSMMNLCTGLSTLNMHEEALTTNKWTVNILRTLAKTNPDIYLPYLVHSLESLSRSFVNIDNINESVSAIEEAVKISRDLQSSATNIELEFQLGYVLTTLSSALTLKNHKEESLKVAQESLEICDNAINKIRGRTSDSFPVTSFGSPWASFFDGISNAAIISYGRALNRLSISFQALGHLEDAFHTAKKALDVLSLSSKGLIDDPTEIQIAFILLRISHQDYHPFMALEHAMFFSERAVKFFKVLCFKDVDKYGIFLCEALCGQATILEKLERQDESLALCQETTELMNDIIVDQLTLAEALSQLSFTLRQLKRHDEAATLRTESVTIYSRTKGMNDKEAHGYFDLGVELQLSGRRSEAIKALQAAHSQYRVLALKEPKMYTKNVGRTLNQLTMNLVHCKEFNQAFNLGHESLKLHESLIETDPSVLAECIFAIRLNYLVANVADNEDKCVARAQCNVMCARNIARLHPKEGNLLVFQMVHGLTIVLCQYNRISEARTVIQEALDWHEQNPSEDEQALHQYMCCLITTGAVVFNQGYIKNATEYIQKSIDIGRPFSSYRFVSSNIVGSMYRRVEIFFEVGLYPEAMKASKDCVEFARQHNLRGTAELIRSLHVAGIASKYGGKLNEAIVYIQEALELSRSEQMIELSLTQPFVLLLEAKSLTYFCDILADSRRNAEALIEGKAAVDSALKLKFKHATLPWSAYIEPIYIDALYTYSLRLAASGNLFDSLDQLIQVRSFYERRVQSRLVDALILARVLHSEGILCCAAGRPDGGAVAAAKYHDLQKRLRVVLPELAQNVEVGLKRERNSPSWIALIERLNLKCDHEH